MAREDDFYNLVNSRISQNWKRSGGKNIWVECIPFSMQEAALVRN